jgi:spore germination protein YaaH
MRLFYYQGGAQARSSFFSHPSSIDIFAPQVYAINDSGHLAGSLSPALLTFAKKHSIRVMPLVVNTNFDTASYQAVLDNSVTQATIIQAMVVEAKKNGYWGWQLDFEQIDASYKEKYSTFVKNVYNAMQQNGLKLSVAVVAKVSDVPSDYPNNLWQRLIGVYDYSALANSSDFISVMSYDDPNSRGPITGQVWLQRVLAYSLQYISKQKLSLGIPLYYWLWNDSTGKRVGIGGRLGIQNVLRNHKVSLHYSAAQQEPYLHYYHNGQGYTLWYENARSVSKKIALIKQNGLYGFSAWDLGLELTSVYSAIK